MSCTGDASYIGNWATGLWTTIGSPANLSALVISGYAVQSFTLGRLDAYIGLCHSGISGAYVCPDLDDGSLAIISQMFLQSYYQQLMLSVMGAGGAIKAMQEVRDGDSVIRWVNASELAKTYLKASKDAENTLNNLVRNYVNNSLGGNMPKDVSYLNIDNSWNGSAAFNGGGVIPGSQ